MNPDYNKMVQDLLTPVVIFPMLIITGISISLAIQLLRRESILEKKLGKEKMEWLLKEEQQSNPLTMPSMEDIVTSLISAVRTVSIKVSYTFMVLVITSAGIVKKYFI